MDSLELDVCAEPYAKMLKTMESFETLLQSKIELETDEVQKDAKELEDESNRFAEEQKKDAVWFKFDTWMAETEILIPFVEVTMRNQPISMDVPEFRVDTTEIGLKVPEVTMVNKKIGQVPHTKTEWRIKNLGFGVKTKVPVTTVWWEDIFTKVPEVTMKDRSIKLDVPQVKMTTKEIALKLPETKFSQKKIIMKLPQFRLISMGINSKPDDEGAKRLEERGKDIESRSVKAINEAMGEAVNETEQQVTTDVHGFFECQRGQITAMEAAATSTFDALLVGMKASQQNLLAQVGDGSGHEAVLAQISQNIEALSAERKRVSATFDQQLLDLLEAEKKTLHDFIEGIGKDLKAA